METFQRRYLESFQCRLTADSHIYGPTYTVNGISHQTLNTPSDVASGDYTGKTFDKVTTNWLNHPGSNLLTVTTRPTSWQ
ncbi:hypothetical protein [Nitrosomonas sp. PY1]|uniref:hypothetical protein n=1 Tax=Nitrosomonas sp. PY1 TaxID=1803906 RepID=UPI001FC8D619|nr:hypothetical protein [Nitrosomonas sp. PY1]